MTRVATHFRSTDFRMRDLLQSRGLEISFAVLFLLTLATGMAYWDEMASTVPGNSAGWINVTVCAALCSVFLTFSRRRLPLLLCAAFLMSVRLIFVFAETAPPARITLTADCLGICTSLSVIVFRTEIASMWHGIRGKFSESLPHNECVPAVASSV